MINGIVNQGLEIIIRIPIQTPTNAEVDVDAVLDTGFNGALTLPPALISSLGLTWSTVGRAILADGKVEEFDVYLATIVWDGLPQVIFVQETDSTPLIGMKLLAGYDLFARIRPGGAVQIKAAR